MAIKIYWTNFAKKELKNIFDYYKIKASPKVANKIVTDLFNKTTSLQFQNKIGQQEELLLDYKEKFRYLIFKNYKIIYWFNAQKNRIEINDVFDVRQNPIKIKREK